MCGIAGYVGGGAGAGREFVERALGLLAHRGPDDHGAHVADGVVLGFRRLSVLDLSTAGHQPMVSPDGRYTLVFNGEIYNHRSLRPALEKAWTFKSHCDTETLLAALVQSGPAAIGDLVGMWAFAMWDATEKRLLLSRDRYGQKPLYWCRNDDGSLVFASEISPLVRSGRRPRLDALAMAEFLATGNYGHLGERTFFDGILQFPAGHWTWIKGGERGMAARRYWRFPALPSGKVRPFDGAAKREFRRTFEEAVSSQLLSDVPLAATLSGGIDSSAIVGAMVTLGGGPVRAFTAQSAGSPNDESRYVDAVARKWGRRLEVERLQIERMSLSKLAADVIRAQEEPFGDPSIIAHYLIVRAVRKAGITVLLGGQGADELLLGYPHYSPALLASGLRRGQLRWALTEVSGLGLSPRALVRTIGAALSPTVEKELRARARRGLYHWLSPELRSATIAAAPRLAASSNLDQVWLENVEQLSLPHLVHYDDRNTMAYSIEGRMPFLDHRLADLIVGLDPQIFLSGGRRKQVLREACDDLLPDEVKARRDKVGFHTPLTDLMHAEVDWVQRTVTGEEARALALYDVDLIQSRCAAIRSGRIGAEHAGQIWRALAAVIWVRIFNVDCGVVAPALTA